MAGGNRRTALPHFLNKIGQHGKFNHDFVSRIPRAVNNKISVLHNGGEALTPVDVECRCLCSGRCGSRLHAVKLCIVGKHILLLRFKMAYGPSGNAHMQADMETATRIARQTDFHPSFKGHTRHLVDNDVELIRQDVCRAIGKQVHPKVFTRRGINHPCGIHQCLRRRMLFKRHWRRRNHLAHQIAPKDALREIHEAAVG